MNMQFLKEFFSLSLPVPGKRYEGGLDAKSDLKLVLEIATNSRLKQGQDKKNQNKQIFYCRSLGKECFKIQVEFFKDGSYQLVDDYTQIRHKDGCEKVGESPNVIKIYNLMMLKRQLISNFMVKNSLQDSSPEAILQKLSGQSGEYFYCASVQDLQSRRKLKKRFDNIINISIKKRKEPTISRQPNIQTQNFQILVNKSKNRKGPKTSNTPYKKKKQIRHIKKQIDSKQLQFLLDKPRKKAKVESNSSILFLKNIQQDNKICEASEIFIQKQDSIFQQPEQDYFKKTSDMHIILNKLNQAGQQNYWPQSDNSIVQSMGDKFKMDDFFATIKNSLMKSLERKSLVQIDNNCGDLMQNIDNDNF